MERPNTVRLETHGQLTLMIIEGDLTSYSEPYLEDAYRQIEQHTAIPDLLLVFEKDIYINSGGISALLLLLSQIRKLNMRVGIAGISDHFAKIFKMVGVHKLAPIFGSLEEAKTAFE